MLSLSREGEGGSEVRARSRGAAATHYTITKHGG